MKIPALNKAQSNMMMCVGICLGIEMFRNKEVDENKSFFQNAIDCLERCGDDLVTSMVNELQNHINVETEREHLKKLNGEAPISENKSADSES